MRPWLLSKYFGAADVAIDLGTANTRLYVLHRGIVADEPTRVAAGDRNMESAQSERASPLSGGVIHDIGATARLLGRLLRRTLGLGLTRSRALVCAPSDASPEERSNLLEAVRRAGISRVKLLAEPWASAVGAGLDITSPYGQMLVDIGDGVTDMAVIRSREIVVTQALRRAGGDLRSALQQLVKEKKKLFLPWHESDRLVRETGAVDETFPRPIFSALALDRAGAPVRIELGYEEVFETLYPVMTEIVGTIRRTLEDLPLDLAVEVSESGISLSGGGACLRGIDRLIARETSAKVKVAVNPMRATINGAGEILEAAGQAGLWEAGWDSSRGFGA